MVAHATKKAAERTDDSFDVSKAQLVRIGPRGHGRLSLRSLREAAGLTQKDVARKSGLAQPEVSKLETAESLDDRQLSTLRRYCAAMGDELELVTVSKYGHRIGIAPPARRLTVAEARGPTAAEPSRSIQRRVWDARDGLRCATRELSAVARMAPAAGEPWVREGEPLRKLALLADIVSQLGVSMTVGLLQKKKLRESDLAFLDEMTEIAGRELRKNPQLSPLRDHPTKPADLVRILRSIGILGLSPAELGAPDDPDPPRHRVASKAGKTPSGEDRVPWLTEMGWREGALDGLVLHVFDALEKHGHLLGIQPPAELKARLREKLTDVRQRQVNGRKKDVDSYLRAVFDAYGVPSSKLTALLKTKARRK